MKITNQTRGTLVASSAIEARSFSQRLLGLMGRAELPVGGALVLDATNWVHTFWMRFPLDVIYFDRRGRVVGVSENLIPNRIGRPIWRAHAVIELNRGVIRTSETQLGDLLRFE
ncbi:MAG: DUF192 domain-containing protein [Chloroflexi bacterium]|nr:DUF192 domain-containing protein [Chloroflexota bacterium]MBI3733733.1 DUF192 domain-containing protein [Chloroflexota bacterium]